MGRPEPALGHFRHALELGPEADDLGHVLLYAATCLKELERWDEAIEVLERAVEADPDELAVHNLQGYCNYRSGRYGQAVSCFRRALEIDPRSGIDCANLASNLRKLGRIDEAVPLYRKALELDPSLAFARAHLLEIEGDG